MSNLNILSHSIKAFGFAVAVMAILMGVAGGSWAKDIRVKSGATGSNSGTSWSNAYKDLQAALSAAVSGDKIWVAAGTYRPTSDTDRSKSFLMKVGVAVYGGFAGTETSRGQRNWTTNKTILSGDIGIRGNPEDNSYHVVVGANNVILDGFTITGGFAGSNYGAGMINDSVSPAIANCTFTSNTATYGYGGGMYNSNASPTLTNCTFIGNLAAGGGGVDNEYGAPTLINCTFRGNWGSSGGGISNNYSSPNLSNCIFIGNTAGNAGGGMYSAGTVSQPVVTNCTFTGNSALNYGGGMYNNSASPTVTNCSFAGNTVTSHGGGMANYNGVQKVTNCTFSGNTAGLNGGGMHNTTAVPTLTNCTFTANSALDYGGGIYVYSGTTAAKNCILWDNNASTGPEFFGSGGNTTFRHCDIQGSNGSGLQWTAVLGTDGGGNIDADPKFKNLAKPAGSDGISRTADDGLALRRDSPCIDTGANSGSPSSDILGIPRPLDGDYKGLPICDIGAYEFWPPVTGVSLWGLYQ